MNDQWIKNAIYNLIFQQLTKHRRPGLLGWLARLVKHPYGWTEWISAEDKQALKGLAEQWNISEAAK